MKIRKPRSVAAATELLERFAVIDYVISSIDGRRNAAIATANAAADTDSAALIEEREAIRMRLAEWWPDAAAQLLPAKRKSMVLGGCQIGTAASKAALQVAGEEEDIVQLLAALRWAKPFLRTKVSLDRVAVLGGLEGPRKLALAELGLSRKPGEDVFFLRRAEQEGTRS